MDIDVHLEKIARYEAALAHYDPVEDFELSMWCCMNAATNALNALLHHFGLTEPGRHFPHQIPGIYVEPQPVGGRWKQVVVPPGDLIHIGFPPIRAELPASLSPLLERLHGIELLRESHVRGDGPIDAALAADCRAAYADFMAGARALLGRPAEGCA